MENEGDQLLRRLRQARRRIGLTLGASVATQCLAYWALAALTWLGIWGATSDRTRVFFISSLAIAAGAAVGLTAWRTPSLARTARLLDERCSLAQRVESSLEVATDPSTIADLLRRDAVSHLGRVDLRGVFPLRIWPRRRRTLLVGLSLAATALVVRWIVAPQIWLPAGLSAPPQSQETAAASSSTTSTAEGEPEQPGKAVSGARAFRGADPDSKAAAAPDQAIRSSAAVPVELAEEAVGGEQASGADLAAPEPAGIAPQASRQEPGPGRMRAADSGTAGPGATATTDPGVSARAQADMATAAAEGVIPQDDHLSLEPFAGEGMPDWPTIEQALVREQFPPGLEQHIRTYFLAISRPRTRP